MERATVWGGLLSRQTGSEPATAAFWDRAKPVLCLQHERAALRGRTYGPFAVYAELEHSSTRAAAQQLYREDFGDRMKPEASKSDERSEVPPRLAQKRAEEDSKKESDTKPFPLPEWEQPMPFGNYCLPSFPTDALPEWLRRIRPSRGRSDTDAARPRRDVGAGCLCLRHCKDPYNHGRAGLE